MSMELYLILFSIEDTFKSKEWYLYRTDKRYRSNFLSQEGVDAFIDRLKRDYPDSNLAHDGKYGYRYHIIYTVLKADTLENDKDNLWNLLYLFECEDGLYE